MLSPAQQIAFVFFACIALASAAYTWRGLHRRIAAGRADTDARFDRPFERLWYALTTTLTQSRTFRKRPWVSFFHSFIFYGFTFYLLVNLIDAAEGFMPFTIRSTNPVGAVYNLLADLLSTAVLIGVIALVLRRFLLPSRRDFRFNERTLLHPSVNRRYIRIDSAIVSTFILFHVGSRALGAGAKLAAEGPDRFQPFATLLSHAFSPQNAYDWRVVGYWGALGSVLAFLAYFPFSKHIHIFMAPVKYAVKRSVPSGVLPALALDMEAEEPRLGAAKLDDLAWPRLLDAYACIQCNRCQDVCPATATGKALSPSALEINKRMELNQIARQSPASGPVLAAAKPLLSFALSPEAAWACTTCGACIEVCPVQDEPMLDIIDIRRQQVMIAGEFPAQLQSAFRGMERSNNPWGINHDKRLDWAEGLAVKTTDENPNPDVLFWVGCAASYDPQSQKTARAFVQLLDHAGVDFAVLGKKECCTGDSARRAGNEYLYRQLADQNVSTLNQLNPKLIVATCPHCMNSLGKEYAQIGGDYKVMHHTAYLETLVAARKLTPDAGSSTVAFHDPCYLGRHNGVYDAPRNLLNVLSNSVVELDRNRENSFCCGAGGAQFWKEEEPGTERISDNRRREAERRLAGAEDKVLAVGCPFCKSMLDSTPGKGAAPLPVRDIAELLLEGVQRNAQGSTLGLPQIAPPLDAIALTPTPDPARAEMGPEMPVAEIAAPPTSIASHGDVVSESSAAEVLGAVVPPMPEVASAAPSERKKWSPKPKAVPPAEDAPAVSAAMTEPATMGEPSKVAPATVEVPPAPTPAERKKWSPKAAPAPPVAIAAPDMHVETAEESSATTAPDQQAALPEPKPDPETVMPATEPVKRKAWTPKRPSDS
jgi:Fe-S oxidoreductase/nitrate reductase gamma subunit